MIDDTVYESMQEYDIALKTFLRNSRESFFALTSAVVDRWLNVELPVVNNRRVDLLGEASDGRLIHIELQSTNDPKMALRMAEYSIAIYRRFGRFPEQIVLYVGETPLRMTGNLSGPNFEFDCRIVDIRELDGERLLASDRIEDNVIAVLARVDDKDAVVKRILSRIAGLDPAERDRAFAGFVILAGLRRLAKVIEREASQMPILDDIMDHEVLGPRIRRAEELAMARGREQGLARGLEQGRELGLEQGRHDGELAVVLRLVEKRFGTISAALRNRLEKMPPAELEAVALRVLDIHSVEELLD